MNDEQTRWAREVTETIDRLPHEVAKLVLGSRAAPGEELRLGGGEPGRSRGGAGPGRGVGHRRSTLPPGAGAPDHGRIMSKPFRDSSDAVGLDVVVTLSAPVVEQIGESAKERGEMSRAGAGRSSPRSSRERVRGL